MNRAERRQQKKASKPQPDAKWGSPPKTSNPAERQGRVERGLVRHVSQQKGRGS